jgi:hypothetical protein
MHRPSPLPLTLTTVCALLIGLTGGCGGRSAGLQQESGPGVKVDAEFPDGGPSSLASCVIAVPVDSCCMDPMPVPATAVAADPCLVPYPAGEIPEICRARRPTCGGPHDGCVPELEWPKSRLVEAGPGGTCQWKDECQTDADCVLAWDYRGAACCRCAEVFPRTMVDTDRCLVLQPEDALQPSPPPVPPKCPFQPGCAARCSPCEGGYPRCFRSPGHASQCSVPSR